MKLGWVALFALVLAPTLPAYAGGAGTHASAAPMPSTAPSAAKPADASSFAAEVLILHATNDKTGVDQRIGKLPELGKPPFSNYDSYRLIDRARLPLKKDDPENLKLPNGRTLQVRLLEQLEKDSVRMSASINRPSGKEFLPLLEVKAKVGQAFIVAGQSYKKGILVLVIRVAK